MDDELCSLGVRAEADYDGPVVVLEDALVLPPHWARPIIKLY